MKKSKLAMSDIWMAPSEHVELRDIGDPIDWLPFEPHETTDGRFVIRAAQNNEHDLAGAAEAYRTGFPVIRGTELEILFKAEGFPLVLGQGEQFNKGDFFMLVVEELDTGKIAGAAIIRMWKCQRNGEFVALTVHADFQKNGLGRELQIDCDQYFERCGIEMAFVFLATEHPVTQRFSFEQGFHPVGVFYGYYRVWSGKDNTARRANCVLAQKFYGGAEKMCPTDLVLMPQVQNLLVPLAWNYPTEAVTEFMDVLLKGIPNCQSVGIFFADKRIDDTYISCYADRVDGIPSTRAGFQNQPTDQFTWFMPKIYATQGSAPEEHIVISDYALIPDDAPLKQYYPPFFVSVADYVLWDGDEFLGWIGILSASEPIDWDASMPFIVETIEKHKDALVEAYRATH